MNTTAKITDATTYGAGRREWMGLVALSLPTLLLSIDASVLYLALPSLSETLRASSTQQLWIMDIYGFMIAGFLITMGTLGDRIGHRRLLLIGAAGFGLASIGAAFSPSANWLIIARAAMGIAGATIMPSTLAIVRNLFHDPHQRATALSVWMSCFMVGMIGGPLVGGVVLEHYRWGVVFLLGVPVMLILLLTGPWLLPEHRATETHRLDYTGVAHSLAAILPLIYGLTELARNGWNWPSALAVVGGVSFGLVFIFRQLRLADPLLDLRLFSRKAFSNTLLIMLLTAVIMGGMGFFVTLYLQMVAGFPPLLAGLWLIPQALGMIIGSWVAPIAARRFPPAQVLSTGLVVTTIGFVLLANTPSFHGLLPLVGGFFAATLGVAPVVVLGTNLVIGSVPPEKGGSAASMSETSNQLGIALGVAFLGSIGAIVYRIHLPADAFAGMPGTALAAIRENITGAAKVAANLPHPKSDDLLLRSRMAFTAGLNTVAWVGAVVFAGLAILAARNRYDQ